MRSRLLAARLWILIMSFVLLLPGCGGGSAGTGTGSSTLEGSVRNSRGDPVAGATITLPNSGEIATTDHEGDFSLPLETSLSNLEMDITVDGKTSEILVPANQTSPEALTVTIELDDTDQLKATSEIDVRVSIIGECDPYFENNRTIRQANPVPQGKECLLKVAATVDGAPYENMPLVMEKRACAAGSPWVRLFNAHTALGALNPGVAQILFPYFDDETNCLYRILAPYTVPGIKQTIFLIKTFTAQNSGL